MEFNIKEPMDRLDFIVLVLSAADKLPVTQVPAIIDEIIPMLLKAKEDAKKNFPR